MSPEKKIQQLEQKVDRLEKVACDVDFGCVNMKTMRDMNKGFYNLNESGSDEMDLLELWSVLWKGRLKIFVLVVLCTTISTIYTMSLPDIYKSEALLVANGKEGNNSGLSALAGQFGGLASLAGVNLGSGGIDQTSLALEVLKSREFLYKFINDNQLKVAIMATNGWNRNNDTFSYDSQVYDFETKSWVREVEEPFKAEPSIHETFEVFLKENLTLSKNDETGMIRLAIEHYSPFLAKNLVDKLIQSINETIKQQDMEEATKSISYLEKELKNTKLSGAQSMFYQLIEQQQQTLMLTKVRDDYVLKVIDNAVVAEEEVKPLRLLIVFVSIIMSILIGVIYTLSRNLLSNKRESSK